MTYLSIYLLIFKYLLHIFFSFYTWVLWPPFCSKWTYVDLVQVGVISLERPINYLELNVCCHWNKIGFKSSRCQKAYGITSTSRWCQKSSFPRVVECSALSKVETNINMMIQVEEWLIFWNKKGNLSLMGL